jgi:hypothetical protein
MYKIIYTLLASAVCLTANSQTYNNGTSLFDESFVHRIDVTFTQTDFWDSLSYYYDEAQQNGGDTKYLQTIVSIDGNVFNSVGFKQKGYYSNWGAIGSNKKPFKINLAKYLADQKYDGLKKINLSNGFEDPSMMRDVLAYKFMRDAGIPAPRTAYVKLYLNNTYWGLYIMVEELDKNFLENRYANKDGNLYKCISNTSLSWQGTNYLDYTDEFDLQTNKTLNNWSPFVNLVDEINNSTTADFVDSLEAVMEVEKYLTVLAADVILYNWDSYYDHGRNFFLYQNPDNSKINWLPWDYNLAFSTSETNLIVDYSGVEAKPLVQRIQADLNLRSRYFNRVCILMDNYFTIANLEPFINQTAALIRPDLVTDNNKFFTISEFDINISNDLNGSMGVYKGLKQFINERHSAVSNQLNAYNHHCTGLGVEESSNDSFSIFPNPFESSFTIRSNEKLEKISIYSIAGQKIVEVELNSYEEVIQLESIENGAYLIVIQSNGKLSTKKLVKN